jgi:hypothetical protein
MSAIDVLLPNGDTQATEDPSPHRKHGVMRALKVPIEDVTAALKRVESRQASNIVVGR